MALELFTEQVEEQIRAVLRGDLTRESAAAWARKFLLPDLWPGLTGLQIEALERMTTMADRDSDGSFTVTPLTLEAWIQGLRHSHRLGYSGEAYA